RRILQRSGLSCPRLRPFRGDPQHAAQRDDPGHCHGRRKDLLHNDSDLFCYDFLGKRTTRPLAGRLNKKLDIRTIVIDRETIWLGTYHNGIIGYDRETGRITEIPVHKDFGNAVVWDMVLFDRQLWCATDLGLFRTDLTGDPLRGEFIASPDPGSKSFVAVASDDNGKLWLSGTSKI
ncbi:hypothetical protein OBE_01264, partial [human gut metagenome]